LLLALPFAVCGHAHADGLPTQIGDCVSTTIQEIGTRLDGVPDSGSAVMFANGGVQVGYDRVAAIEQSRVGDAVRMCLQSIPHNCPRGDDRGRVYRVTNLRTQQTWVRPDSSHSCGGA
jgi:hypothetical protein